MVRPDFARRGSRVAALEAIERALIAARDREPTAFRQCIEALGAAAEVLAHGDESGSADGHAEPGTGDRCDVHA